jgi:beta-glucosidase
VAAGTFKYGKAKVTPGSTNGTRPIRVRFRLTNTGERSGAEVAQVYLSPPSSTGEPVRKLVGFAKVQLDPRRSRKVTVTIDPADVTHPLSYWNTSTNGWATAPGTYTVSVGSSSRDLPQTDTFKVR